MNSLFLVKYVIRIVENIICIYLGVATKTTYDVKDYTIKIKY